MKAPRISRRKFIAAALLASPGIAFADAKCFEPTWLKTSHYRVGKGKPSYRLVHFSDVHHKGDCEYLKSVVARINSVAPDFVCFTGDIIEQKKHLAEALDILSGIKAPMFGVPGNHDFWSRVSFAPVFKCFGANGGAWILRGQKQLPGTNINIYGTACIGTDQFTAPLDPSRKNILLMHYPAWVKKLNGWKFDLMLAGHSHGGQVRIPFYGSVVVPYGVDEYDLGLFHTPAGPLHVTSGIGYIYNYNFRFNCRPEISVIEI